MQNEAHKQLDNFIKRSVKTAGLKSPSAQFTESILSQLETKAVSQIEPLISKKLWVVISIGFIGALIFASTQVSTTKSWFDQTLFTKLPQTSLDLRLPEFNFSIEMIYAICVTGLFLWIQIFYLKHRYNRHFKV